MSLNNLQNGIPKIWRNISSGNFPVIKADFKEVGMRPNAGAKNRSPILANGKDSQ
jgi:hypothetical protein